VVGAEEGREGGREGGVEREDEGGGEEGEDVLEVEERAVLVVKKFERGVGGLGREGGREGGRKYGQKK